MMMLIISRVTKEICVFEKSKSENEKGNLAAPEVKVKGNQRVMIRNDWCLMKFDKAVM